MVRKNIKTGVLAFIVGILFVTSATVAFAGITHSVVKYYGPVLTRYYQNMASASVGTSVQASTEVKPQNNLSAPAGYMGATANLFDSTGVLKKARGWFYNDVTVYGMTINTDAYTIPGTYYSQGITAAYNGSGYNQYYTYLSPNIQL